MQRAALTLALAFAVPVAAAAAGDIHSVDFRHFVYYPSCADFESEEAKVPIQVSGGRFEGGAGTDREGMFFAAQEILYGDLTGDGSDEAVVRTVCGTGGTGKFDEGFVYGMKDGKPVLFGRIPGGDRATGGVRCMRFERGALKVERIGNDTGAARGIDFVDIETWKVHEGRLTESGEPAHRRLGPVEKARPVRFAKGTSSETITGRTTGAEEYALQARYGQTMTVRITSPLKNVAFEIMIDDYTFVCRTTEWTGELPMTGTYRITVLATEGTASYELNVGIR